MPFRTFVRYRFSAFWLRSKCSICSYQLNIWYEVHRTSSILNWFLDGDGVPVACYGSIKCWPCIAVPQGSAHFPTNNPSFSIETHQFMWTCKKSEWYQGLEFIIQCAHDYMTWITPIFKNCCIVWITEWRHINKYWVWSVLVLNIMMELIN